MLFEHPGNLPDFRQFRIKYFPVPTLEKAPAEFGITTYPEVSEQLLDAPGLGLAKFGFRQGLNLFERLVAQVLHAFEPCVFGALEPVVLLVGSACGAPFAASCRCHSADHLPLSFVERLKDKLVNAFYLFMAEPVH